MFHNEKHAEALFSNIIPEWEDNEHTDDTPKRYINMIKEVTQGDLQGIKFTTFESSHDQMVIESPIQFYSMCAHHLVPFFGEAHIGYIPNGQIVGLSKIARVVREASQGIWTQEDLTWTIAHYLNDKLDPVGTAVVMKAEHLCMTMRGVRSPGTKTTTSIMLGAFAEHDRLARQEFFGLIGMS